MFLIRNVLGNLNSMKSVIQIHAQCGQNGHSGHNVQLVVEEEDVKGAENVQRQLFGTDDTFVKEEMILKKRPAMKMYDFQKLYLYIIFVVQHILRSFLN